MSTGYSMEQLVTVRTPVADECQGLYMFGRLIAWRSGNNEPVELGEGVTIAAGGFRPKGGTKTRPRLAPEPGTVLEIADVSALSVRSASVIREFTVVTETDPRLDLLCRRATLLQEVERINAQLRTLNEQDDAR
jgi:hypothetical protein